MKTVDQRFDEKWTPEPNTGCWLWCGAITSAGYGSFWAEAEKSISAHRFSYETLSIWNLFLTARMFFAVREERLNRRERHIVFEDIPSRTLLPFRIIGGGDIAERV